MKDGECIGSPLLVRVNEATDFGASHACVTCVRGTRYWTWFLPSNPHVSLSNPETTARCAVNAAGELASVAAVCKPCEACKKKNLCRADDAGFYLKPATCDDCAQCDGYAFSCSDNNNGRDLKEYKGYGNGDHAQCLSGVCVQCLAGTRCDDLHGCHDNHCGE